ncbi:MAG: NnrU family protein [Aestuariivita sp.]|uniref:NnrU family protein n=1 Tax=Aestuariivita sp. TaxID=1872407 RepID=UPI003BAEEDE7
MSWLLLVLGIALWWGAHLFKRLAPAQRAALGDAGKGILAVALVVSIVLMVIGYRGVDFIPVWSPPSFLIHLNNLLMVIALYLFSPAAKRGKLVYGMRHPMLTGVKIWAVSHLLVNGDLAAIVLFGGLLAWAVVEVIVINKSEPGWQKPTEPGTIAKDAMFLVGSVLLLGVIGYVHSLLGVWPFPS